MPTTTKKGSKTTKAKPRRAAVNTSAAKPAQTIAKLRQELEARDRELTESLKRENASAIEIGRLFEELQERNAEWREALEHQTATSEVLGIISRSPTDVQPVLDAIVESAARVCGIDDVVLRLREGDTMVSRAHFGPIPVGRVEIGVDAPHHRWMGEHGTLHVPDLLVQNDFPKFGSGGFRTYLAVPLRQQREVVGLLNARRIEMRPFTPAQIKLLETFADQAVIAIENARLFKELQERNRDLTEALDQQTATSEILGVIASSPTDLQPVMDAIAASAARLCDARDTLIDRVDGNVLEHVAAYGPMPMAESRRPLTRGTPAGRAIIDRESIHIHDVLPLLDSEYPDAKARQQVTGTRTVLITPLLREGAAIGAIQIRRPEMRPFSEKQIALLKTFADQAVIAIENVRLFKELGERNAELREALEHQTATSEVLGIISRSPTDVQPVLDAIVESAARVCGIDDVLLRLREANTMAVRAHFGSIPIPISRVEISIDEPQYCWMREHGTLHIPDVSQWKDFQVVTAGGWRTHLSVSLRQQGELIGGLTARRIEVRPFTPVQIKLLETFADQAVIAIENVRLFQELKEALEQQTATSEILGVIASSPTDIQPVLDAIAASAARLCGSYDAVIRLLEGNVLGLAAHYGPVEPGWGRERPLGGAVGGAVLERRTVHIPDIQAEVREFPDGAGSRNPAVRTFLATPLLREGTAIGVINIRRTEVKPFTDKQVALLETFASQAVIAIENARLFKELQERNRDLTEALEQQTATSEILRVIASSPTDLQPVLNVVAESAARLCESIDAAIFRIDGDVLRRVASFGSLPTIRDEIAINRSSPLGRAIIDRQPTIHVHDIQQVNETEFTLARGRGIHTVLAVLLLREGVPIGGIVIRRQEIRPFTEKQISLLKTFADQAVIAIENVRLFKELQERNAELREALEHQTATSEVLGIISRSPTDVQPVLDAIVESAARVCGIDDVVLRLREESALLPRAHFGSIPTREKIPIDESAYRAMRERGTVHIPDVRAQNDFPTLGRGRPWLTFLAAPLRQQGELIGSLVARRTEVRPFTLAQIKLLETFADQAVIAIKNVRLFQELTEALEQQTATSEILGVIASSPTDIQPVLDVVAENAARLCDATDAQIIRVEGDFTQTVAFYGTQPGHGREEKRPITRGRVGSRAIVDRQTVHIHDLAAESDTEYPESKIVQQRFGTRTILATPLMREGVAIGGINIRRTEVRPFTDRQIKLLETFASQAVIAIENVRLFKELGERNAELREALEHQTATAEVLGIISRSPTDVQPVLDAIVESAAKVCGIDDVVLRLREGDTMVARAHFGPISIPVDIVGLSIDEPNYRWVREHGTLHIPDARAQNNFPNLGSVTGSRTFLLAPLRQQGELIGTLIARRIDVHPFTASQIKLLETFADQAVIAIENVRLFNELKESLEQQTATSEILGVIASSPTDIQPVLDIVAKTAARLCDAVDGVIGLPEGDKLRIVAKYGAMPSPDTVPLTRGFPAGRVVLDRQTVHIHDILAEIDTEYPDARIPQQLTGTRTVLNTPLLREGVAIGYIAVRRTEVRPFTDKQIALLKTFADQAVIAIENVRLFQELEARTRELARSVGELQALGDVGQAVSSTLDLQTVLSTIVRHAVQLSQTDGGVVYEYEEATEEFHLRASHLMETEIVEALQAAPVRLGQGATGQTATLRVPVQLADISKEQEFTGTRARPIFARLGYRSVLAVPLLREERVLGALTIWRKQAGDFSPEIVNLLQTFATQSALAIQNARLFREIEDKSRQIEAANRHKSEFLANMSHELRTPLTAIIGFSEVLSDKLFGELNDKQNEYMGDIVSSGRHLLSLINDILDLSKVEAGRMELDVTRFDLPMAIDNALILIRERATRHGIKVEHYIDERLGEVEGDERKFKQILLNLLSNAVKFTPEGGSIAVSAALAEDAVEVAVSDTGIGIALENHQTIFEEFRQVGTDAAKKREGTGLGLTLTKKFVELHGGTIRVESAVGRGSTFTFTLPIS